MTTNPLAFTVAEAVKASGIARSSLYLAMKDGSLVARKCGRRTIIEADELRRFLAALPAKEVDRSASPKPSEASSAALGTDSTI